MPNSPFDTLTTLSNIEGPISASGLNRNNKRVRGFKDSRVQVNLKRIRLTNGGQALQTAGRVNIESTKKPADKFQKRNFDL